MAGSHPFDTALKEPGTGGKPPLDERPTGGGGGGGDDDWRPGRRGPHDLLHRVRVTLGFLLAADLGFFALLLVITLGALPGGLRILFLPRILYLNTFLILASSLTVELSRRHIFQEIDAMEEWLGLGRPALRRAQPWVAASLCLSGIFLAGQGYAWMQQSFSGSADTPSAALFRMLTSLHALHLALGQAALLFCLVGLHWLKRMQVRQVVLDAAAWYWHAMNLVWLVLFTFLNFGQAG